MKTLAMSCFDFKAMGSPCEIRVYAKDARIASQAIFLAVQEIDRLEQKYSRFKSDNFLFKVNQAAKRGDSISIDDEFVSLLNFADVCYQESGGLFDITSGVLREIWRFDNNIPQIPSDASIKKILQRIGWNHISWNDNTLNFGRQGMEIDFGGLVKEYAADKAAAICEQNGIRHGVVDLGGDMVVIGPHPNRTPWRIAVQHPREPNRVLAEFEISRGAMASSGDYERYIEIDGNRYCHIFSPKTGLPVKGLAAVTVIAEQCLVAGSACTSAMLQGQNGAIWLDELHLPHVWMDINGQYGGKSEQNNKGLLWPKDLDSVDQRL